MKADEDMQRLIRQAVGLCMKVHRYFGPGRIEKIYENSVAIELETAGIPAVFQAQVDTYDRLVGRDLLDCLVAEKLIVEFKVADMLVAAHEAQIVNYLKSSRLDVGLLVNFGAPSLEFRTKFRERPSMPEIPAPF